MPKKSFLQFLHYDVNEIMFKNLPVSNDVHEFELHPVFQQSVSDCGEDNYDVFLSVEIASTEDHPMPFQLKVALTGHFCFCDPDKIVSTDDKEQIIKRNTVAILFPFIRSIVATLTSNANIPALLLPIVNFAEQ